MSNLPCLFPETNLEGRGQHILGKDNAPLKYMTHISVTLCSTTMGSLHTFECMQ